MDTRDNNVPMRPGRRAAISLHFFMPSFSMHASRMASSLGVQAPFTRPTDSTPSHRPRHCSGVRRLIKYLAAMAP